MKILLLKQIQTRQCQMVMVPISGITGLFVLFFFLNFSDSRLNPLFQKHHNNNNNSNNNNNDTMLFSGNDILRETYDNFGNVKR